MTAYQIQSSNTPNNPDNITIPVHYVDIDPLFNASIARGVRSLCITSSMAREGVSTVAYSIAKRSAASGKKTLLVDANLNNPCVGDRLGITQKDWDGELSTLTDALHHFEGINLSILTGLNRPIAPLNLRDPNGIKEWIENLLAQFDIIIFDCAPIGVPCNQGIPSDIIATNCDGCVLVAQATHTPQEQLLQAISHLQNVQVPLLGCVLNRQHYPGLSTEMKNALLSTKTPKFMETLWTRFIIKLQHIETML